MNRRMVLYTVGSIALVEAALLLFPLAVSLIYGEVTPAVSFGATAAIALGLGLLFTLVAAPSSKLIYSKEGFAIVAIAWMMMSAVGALPFVFSGEIPSYVDAFFETVSGFTTTGATILTNIEALSYGMLFWRSFTHWIGGMGVLVLVTAVVPNIADRSINILKAEMTGPTVGKLVPRARDTAKILYYIYIGLTVIQMILLRAGGMPVFDSVVHSFATAGTGGFGIKGDSIASYSPYIQWVITAFMLLFSVNFNMYYLLLLRKLRTVAKSSELRFFSIMVMICIGVISVNIMSAYDSFSEALRHASFQVASIVSTTGFSTANFDLWPGLSKAILMLLMVVGACAGSTGGGLKVSRVMILFKSIGSELRKLLHPRAVRSVYMEGKKLDESTLNGVTSYFAIYIVCLVLIFVLVSFEPFSMETNFTATVACFNNIGPGFDGVGPMYGFAEYSAFSKILLSFAMLLGRLEIFPLLLGLNPMIWRKRK